MTEKRLRLSEPPIRGFLHHAYPLSILANHNKYLTWFHCQYLQLNCTSEFNDNIPFRLDFFFEHDFLYSFPYIKTSFIHNNLLRTFSKDIIAFIIDAIDSDYYVYTHVDEFYIPTTSDYSKRHFTHNILVSGYHPSKRELTVTGYNHQLRYASYTVPFDTFTTAFEHSNFPVTYLLTYDENHMVPTFQLELVLRYLEDYLHGKNSFIRSTRWQDHIKYDCYGIDIYGYLKRYIKFCYLNKAAPDLIPFHILWEHKQSILSTITYLNYLYDGQFVQLVADANRLVQQSLLLRNLMIKCNIRFQGEIIGHSLPMIDDLKANEMILIEGVLKKIYPFHLQSEG